MPANALFRNLLLRPFRGRRPAPARKPRRVFDRQLEHLEDRITPTGVGNTFYVNDNWFIAIDTAPAGLSNGDTVDNRTDQGGTATVTATFGSNAFSTINAAIAAATGGDTIVVLRGTYGLPNDTTGAVVMNKDNITVRSDEGAAVTTIQGQGAPGGPGNALVYISGSGNTFDGFTVDVSGNLQSNGTEQHPVRVSGDTNVVKNNTVIGKGGAQNGIGVLVSFTGNGLNPNTNSSADNNQILNNTIRNFADEGIDIGGTNLADGTLVKGNTIYMSTYGVYIDRATNSTISENTIYNTEWFGIRVDGTVARNSTGTIIEKNDLHDNGRGNVFNYGYDIGAGIHVQGTSPIIRNNFIHDNKNVGVGVNARAGILVTNSSGGAVANPTISFNSFTGNDVALLNATVGTGGQAAFFIGSGRTSTATVDASTNWWNSTDPATVAGMLQGANIDFTPLVASGTDNDLVTAGFQPDLSSLIVHTLGVQMGSTGRIQEGIDLVTSGGTVNVAAGTYDGLINVTKSLSLKGANAGVHPTTGNSGETVGTRGSESTIQHNGFYDINVAADNVTIDGFTLYSPSGSRLLNGGGKNLNILNNIISVPQNADFNGDVQLDSNVDYTGLTVQYNQFSSNNSNPSNGGNGYSLYLGGSASTFSNVNVSKNTFNSLGNAIFQGTSSPMSNVVIAQNVFDGTIGGTPRVGFATVNFGQAGNLQLTGNLFENSAGTPAQVGVIGGSITGNTFAGNTNRGLDIWGGEFGTSVSTNVAIANNSFTYNDFAGSSTSVGLRLRPSADSAGLNVHDNTFSDAGLGTGANHFAIYNQGGSTLGISSGNNTFNGITIGGVSTPTLAQFYAVADRIRDAVDDPGAALVRLRAGIVYVTPNSFVSPATTAPSIQRAVNAASSGDTVNVQDGSYPGGVIVNKSLTVQHTGAGTATVATAEFNSSGYGGSFEVSANNVTIDGFNMAGDSTTGTSNLYGVILLNGTSGATIQNNTIAGSGIANIQFEDGVTGVSGALIKDNTFGANVAGDFAVYILSGANNTIQHNQFNAGNSGVIAQMSSGPVSNIIVTDNTFTGTGNALVAVDASNIQFTNNTVSNAQGTAVYAGSGVNGYTITGNTITNGLLSAIKMITDFSTSPSANSGVLIQNNSLTGNQYGIFIDANAYTGTLNVLNNTITGSTTRALDIKGPFATLNLTDNDITGNTAGGSVASVTTINLTGDTGADTFAIDAGGDNFARGSNTLPTYTGDAVSYLSVTNLNVFGLAGDDVFTVAPSQNTVISLNGGPKSFGDAGVPPGGDSLNYNPLSQTFTVTPTSISTGGGYKVINFVDIESLPFTPAGADTKRFDFDSVSAATQSGYTGVAPSRVYGSGTMGSDYGWNLAVTSFDRGANGSSLSDAVRDGAYGSADRTFTADVANGYYMVSLKIGDTFYSHDLMRVTYGAQTLLDNFTTPYGQVVEQTFVLNVTNGKLALTFSDRGGTDPNWVVNAVEIRPAALLTEGFAPQTPPGFADGVTVDTFTITGATPNAYLTVSTSLGTITSTDADPMIAGIQVPADGTGVAHVSLRRPTSAGPAVVSTEEVTGAKTGVGLVTYTLAATQRYDFNGAAGQTQLPSAPPTIGGYVGVSASDVYTPARGYGWVAAAVGGYDRGALSGTTNSALLRDGAYSNTARTFQADLPPSASPTQYKVTVTIGDASYAHDNIDVKVAGGASLLGLGNLISTAAGQFVTRTFTVTVPADGHLGLEFVDGGGTDPNWVVNAVEIRPSQASLTVTGPAVQPVTADGVATSTITITGYTPNATYTVSTSLGTIATPDGDGWYTGFQVVAPPSGTFQFTVRAPSIIGSGTTPATVTVADVTGAAVGSTTVTYQAVTPPDVRRFDFNANANATANTFTGVRGSTLFSGGLGYGWQTAVPEFDRGSAGSTVTPLLYRDGVYGTTGAGGQRTFQVQVVAGATYNIRVYVGDAFYARDNIQFNAEGGAFQLVTNTAGGQFTTKLLTNVTASPDGVLDITIQDTGGDPYWVLNGIDVWKTTASDPGPSNQLAAGGAAAAGAAPVLTAADLAPVAAEAVSRWLAAGVTPAQAALLAGVQFQIRNLGGTGGLGLTGLGSQLVVLDDDGAGRGWYVDATPGQDEEFGSAVGVEEQARAGGPAAGRYDLLTVVMHELGHVIGMDDLDPTQAPHDLLTETLGVGVRRLPAVPAAGVTPVGPVNTPTAPGTPVPVRLWLDAPAAAPTAPAVAPAASAAVAGVAPVVAALPPTAPAVSPAAGGWLAPPSGAQLWLEDDLLNGVPVG